MGVQIAKENKMNKKLILVALPALVLTGCNKKLDVKAAVERAEEIKTHEVDYSKIQALKFTYEMSSKESGKDNGTAYEESHTSSGKFEFSRKKSFFHLVSVSESKSTSETEKREEERWLYVKDSNFYSVVREVDKDGETKVYSVVENGGDAFKAALDQLFKYTLSAARGTSYLSIVSQVAEAEEQPAVEGHKSSYKFTFRSKGEGSLTVKGKYTEEESGSEESYTESAKYKVVWEDYFIKNASVKTTYSGKSGEDDYKGEEKASAKLKFKFSAVKYPKLDGYTKQ